MEFARAPLPVRAPVPRAAAARFCDAVPATDTDDAVSSFLWSFFPTNSGPRAVQAAAAASSSSADVEEIRRKRLERFG